MSEKYRYHLI